MPSGYVPGMPKRGPGVKPQWGTVEYQAAANAWNTGTITLSDPGADGFWAIASGNDNNRYVYTVGASQQGHVRQGGQWHNGTNGWTTQKFDIILRTGATWPSTTWNLNFGDTTYNSAAAARFTYTEGFQCQPYQWRYNQGSSTTSSHTTPTAYTNSHVYPGGVAFALAGREGGAASGISGITTASSDAGWVYVTTGQLTALAYYILSTTEIETPPTCTFTSSTTRNCYIGAIGYVR